MAINWPAKLIHWNWLFLNKFIVSSFTLEHKSKNNEFACSFWLDFISFWKLGLNYDFSYLIDSFVNHKSIIYTAINNSFKRFKQIIRSQIVKRLYLSHINQTKFVDKIYRKVSITKPSPICCSSPHQS